MYVRASAAFILLGLLTQPASSGDQEPKSSSLPWSQKLGLAKGMTKSEVAKIVWPATGYRNKSWSDTAERYELDALWELQVEYADGKLTSFRVGPRRRRGRGDFFDLAPRIAEGDLEAVYLIHKVSEFDGREFDPTSLVRAANCLSQLGRDKAVRALETYHELCSKEPENWPKYDLNEERILLLLPMVFQESDGKAFQVEYLKWSDTKAPKKTKKLWESFPLVLVDDLPFLIANGFDFFEPDPNAGPIRTTVVPSPGIGGMLKRCREQGTMRKALRPSSSPKAACEKLMASAVFKELAENNAGKEGNIKRLLRLQASRAVGKPCDDEAVETDARWEEISTFYRFGNYAWDKKRQAFVKGKEK